MLSMKVVDIQRFGGSDVLNIDEVPLPTPKHHEVLVKVHAAGVNPVDYKIRSGRYPAVREDALPYVLGRDAAGDVIAVGPEVTKFRIGEYVFGMPGIQRGAYAEYVLLKESEAAHVPADLDYISAAAVPLAALTAWQGLFRHGGLRAGQSVLIHGGSGGVGHFAIQFAKARGAQVITTVSAEHTEFARKLGADRIIDYKATRFEEEVEDLDMVFDLIGGETQERSFSCLKRGGVLVSTLNEPSQEKASEFGIRALRYTVEESGEDLSEIGRLIDAGLVKPHISRVFPFDEAREAQDFLERTHPEGKVVLAVDAAEMEAPVTSIP